MATANVLGLVKMLVENKKTVASETLLLIIRGIVNYLKKLAVWMLEHILA